MSAEQEWLEQNHITEAAVVSGYFIGKYRVLFGYRLRAGELYSSSCDIDLCCGDSKELYDKARLVYGIKMVSNIEKGKPIFDGLRASSEIKPYHNDKEYMEWLSKVKY